MRVLFTILFVTLCFGLSAQNKARFDSLELAVKKHAQFLESKGLPPNTLADTALVNTLGELWSLFAYVDYKKSLEYGIKMTDLAVKINYPKGIAEGAIRKGVSYDHLGEYVNAMRSYDQALKVQEQMKDSAGILQSYLNRGIVYSKIGNYPLALENTEKSLVLAKIVKDDYGAGCVYLNQGIIYKLQKNYPDALSSYEKAMQIFKDIQEIQGEAAAADNLGELYLILEKPELAEKYLRHCIGLAQNIRNNYILAGGMHALGETFAFNGKLDSAQVYLQRAYDARVILDDKNGLAGTLLALGKVYRKKEQIEKAELYIRKGISMAAEIGAVEFIREGYQLLAEIAGERKDFKNAYEYEVLYKKYDDSLFSIEKDKQFNQLKMKFQLDKEKDSLALQYEKKMALLVSESKSGQRIRNYIVGGLSIILVLLIVTLLQRRKIEQAKKLQALEQERTRISRDLHDDLGTGLTGILLMSEQLRLKNVNHEAEGTLQKIQQTSKKMVDQMGEIVWTMNASYNSMESMLNYIQDYAYKLFEATPIRFSFRLPEQIVTQELDGITRRNIFLVVKESLNNILKHAEAGEVSMELIHENNRWCLQIADNGRGFQSDQIRKFANGLRHMQERMMEVHGDYSIVSNPGKGTITKLTLPV